MNRKTQLAILGFGTLALAGCNTDMWRQPKTDPLDSSEFFADGAQNRPLIPGTIARGMLRQDDVYYVGAKDGKWLEGLPPGIAKIEKSPAQLMALLNRGQERYKIYCVPCHGQLGDGQGMIAHRGFQLKRPVGNYHTPRLLKMPLGHFYDVMTNGYGAMYSYASRIEPQDRWAIAAYIRVLQLSQNTNPSDLRPEEVSSAAAPDPSIEVSTTEVSVKK